MLNRAGMAEIFSTHHTEAGALHAFEDQMIAN